jgi:hypothetical protein
MLVHNRHSGNAMHEPLGPTPVFNDEKKLFMASSHSLPDRLIEQTTALSAISRWN